MYSYTIQTPGSAPLVAADIRDWLRTSDTSEDTLLGSMIEAVNDKFCNDTGGCVLTSTVYRLYLDHWPSVLYGYRDQVLTYPVGPALPLSTSYPNPTIYINRFPVTAIASVEYLDVSAAWQTLTGTTTDITGTVARVVLPAALPQVHLTQKPTVRVNFTAGFASPPAQALMAIRLGVAHWYNNREAYGSELKELPAGWQSICTRYSSGVNSDWNR